MKLDLSRLFAIGLYPTVGVLLVLQVFDPAAMIGVSVMTGVGATMTVGMGWCAVVSLVYGAPWTAAGFSVMAATFGYQTLSGWAIQSQVVAYALVSGAVLLLFIGNVRDTPTAPELLVSPQRHKR